MDIYFSGAEQPIYLRTLVGLGVKHVAISFYEWRRRHSKDELLSYVPEEVKVCITAGVARKEMDFNDFSKDYLTFCEKNADHVLVYDMDAPSCPLPIRLSTRNALSVLPHAVIFPVADEQLDQLASKYEHIGVNARLAKSLHITELRRTQASLYGSNVNDTQVLRSGRFVATTTLAWLSGKRYGELWVFTRNTLKHYGAGALGKAVRAHSEDIKALGVDPLACLANDHNALTELAVRSLQAMADNLSKRPRDRHQAEIADISAQRPFSDPREDELQRPVEPLLNLPEMAIERERELLPGLGIKVQGESFTVESSPVQLRQCDSCYLSEVCPKYEPAHACAFSIPVEFKTDAQWEAATQALLEVQFQRIQFARFGEQLSQGGLNPRVGQEMDRFFKMLGNIKELKAPVVSPQAGVLSKVFGVSVAALEARNGDQKGNDDQEDFKEVEAEEGKFDDGPPESGEGPSSED